MGSRREQGRLKNSKALLFAVFLCMALLLLDVTLKSMPASADDAHPIPVFVSIEPQVTFVKRIGGDRVTVEALVLPGESPATYSPNPAQMARLAKSKLFFRIGVPFEDQLMYRIQTVAKHVRVVDTREGISLRKMEEHHNDHTSHGDDHEHDGYDPHIWLNPLLVIKQAATIRDALIHNDPAGQTVYESNCQAFISDAAGK